MAGTVPHHQEAEGGRWLRPASPLECRFEAGHRNQCLLVSYCCSFSASRPVTQEEANRALTVLYRTSINLRLCLGYKEGQMWLREMPQEKIDFQMIENGNVQQMYENMFNKRYNTASGPLWIGRLIPCNNLHPLSDFPESVKVFPREDVKLEQPCVFTDNSSKESNEETGKMTTNNDDGREKNNKPSSATRSNSDSNFDYSSSSETYPYKYHLLLGFHHLIADGYTCLRVYGLFMKLLNKILDGQNPDNEVQVASLVDVTKELKMMSKIEESLKSDSFIVYRKKIEFGERTRKRPLFLDVYPAPTDEKWRTANLFHHFEEDTTRSFIRKCKREGVTFHSGFSRVIGAATVEMLEAAGVHQESYEISNVHVVDHRRYNGNVNNSFGSCVGYINANDTFTDPPLNNFWEGAKKQDVELRAKISSKSSLENDVINRLVRPDNFNFDRHFQSPRSPSAYFTTSNMLDATSTLGDCGEHIRVDWLHGGTSNHRSGNICVHIFQTLRGRLQYGLNYSTQHLHTDTARALAQTVSKVLNRVIRI